MRFKNILNKITGVIFPGRCAICDRVIVDEKGICATCEKITKPLMGAVCMKCGKKLDGNMLYCYDCSRKDHKFVRNFSVFEYPHVRESLYRFKYQGRAEYAKYYAMQAYRIHGERLKKLNADVIIPVPLHVSRYRKRGYNQAEELAKELSRLIHVPVKTHYIKRIKATKPLKTLDVLGRQNNLKKAFLIMQNDVKLKTIILVDDIYTTGATLDEISGVCKAAGVENIYSLTVAVGDGL